MPLPVIPAKPSILVCLCSVLCLYAGESAFAGQGKLQETAGVTQVEGSGGGGLVPWATLSGYDSRDETASAVFMSRASLDDYRLQMFGASVSLYDRVEVSLARQTFELRDIPFGQREINQQILGVKARIAGDVVYSSMPQISAGVQYKELQDDFIATAAGADDSDHGTDFYVAATKAHLGVLFGYNLVWNATLRATKANQFGLLGFGGDRNDDYEIMAEGSLAVLLSRKFALGAEYRQKPDNLSFAEEQDAYDVFVAYIPNKHFNITGAWVNLGSIAGANDQSGAYLSLTGYLW
ncbi:DUF3034 family protein [Ketobacter sp. MCCC 1A13808]|uniref:DUF3034 family protein n=1 Tax=Ketobacter sp. MCCC 1A13808 TaxID=2602738 RepID=UPI000F1FA177|nr:DUF3034 family protein [Ketobacter sp. MCCC 1A13808]MVF14503.1 DUF3034 family protein [Ketobacter sp. MCCC 1A13808]RLP55028.1 MAG: DUF3034 family protein [Ketobacter sp.]